jgi:hypothetical protein
MYVEVGAEVVVALPPMPNTWKDDTHLDDDMMPQTSPMSSGLCSHRSIAPGATRWLASSWLTSDMPWHT